MTLVKKVLIGAAVYEVAAFVYNFSRPSGQTQAPLDGIGWLYQTALAGVVGSGSTSAPVCTAWQ